MNYDLLKTQLNNLIEIFKQNAATLRVAIVASVDGKTINYKDYKKHSVKTCFLAQAEIEKFVDSLQANDVYTSAFFEIEDFLYNYLAAKDNINFVFESSPKGIGRGRDTLLPALCDVFQLKHTGTDAVVNAIFSSKYHWISILHSNFINVPKTFLFSKNNWLNEPDFGMKVIFKLNNECASIGLTKNSVMFYEHEKGTLQAKKLYEDYNQPIIAQEFISGYEIEVPIIANKRETIILPPMGINHLGNKFFKAEFFDYDTIYNYDYSLFNFDDEQPALCKKLRDVCNKVVKIFDIIGYVRMDCRINSNGDIYIFDINNDPDLGEHSSFDFAFNNLGLSNAMILKALIGNALT